MKRTVRRNLFAVLAMLAAVSDAKADTKQDYLLTFHQQHPAGTFQEPLCVTVTVNGTTLRYRASGGVTLYFNQSSEPNGQWFAAQGRDAIFTVPLDASSATFITFVGFLSFNGSGKPQITGASFVEFENGAAAAAGTFSAAKSTCSSYFAPPDSTLSAAQRR